MAETGGTPLPVKLGVREGATLVLAHAPDGFDLGPGLPPGVTVARRVRRRADVVMTFVTRAVELDDELDRLAPTVFPDGGLWVAWPKRSSGVPSDVTDHLVRDAALARGLVDNKVCAVDATWTALRLVWRLEHRPPA